MSKTDSIFKEPNIDAIRQLLRSMAGKRVLVAGDAMLDRYLYGSTSRISPEAPVQIVVADREESLLGGAANVAKCLVALGAKVTLCCVIGTDRYGDEFMEEAKSLGISTKLILRDSTRPTTVKTRIVSGRQHILRVDRESKLAYPEKLVNELVTKMHAAAGDADAVLLSDYDKGVLAPVVCSAAIQAAGDRPIVVDPKGFNWKKYLGATVLKPNWNEAQSMLATRDSSILLRRASGKSDEAEAIAHRLRKGVGVKNVILTRDEHGMSIACPNNVSHSFGARTKNVEDEAGAGDVVAAVSCLALATGATVPMAAWLSNVAAGVKVSKFATSTVSDHEILEALGDHLPPSERKVMTQKQAAELSAKLRKDGKRVVFTNGCFDILHLGHVTYLEKARRLGDALIVGINTDASVRKLKGPERPVQTETDRARIIASQECVDAVVLFGDDTPLELIKATKPDVLCKGADYKKKQDVVGWDVVEGHGGRVVLIDFVEGRSSSKVIEKMNNP